MNTINKIAIWLLDRIEAGQHEENGSLDYKDFLGLRVTTEKAGERCLVYMDESAIPDFILTERMTLADIEQEIKTWLMK